MNGWFINGKKDLCISFKITELKYISKTLHNEIEAKLENDEPECYTTNEFFNLIQTKLKELEIKK